MSEEWARWQCATCQAAMEDPVTIRQTTCDNGHVNYLGPILPSGSGLYDRGSHRRAFKTRADRAAAAREDRNIAWHMRLIAKGFNQGRKERLARG
jgi:hypothetical protein